MRSFVSPDVSMSARFQHNKDSLRCSQRSLCYAPAPLAFSPSNRRRTLGTWGLPIYSNLRTSARCAGGPQAMFSVYYPVRVGKCLPSSAQARDRYLHHRQIRWRGAMGSHALRAAGYHTDAVELRDSKERSEHGSRDIIECDLIVGTDAVDVSQLKDHLPYSPIFSLALMNTCGLAATSRIGGRSNKVVVRYPSFRYVLFINVSLSLGADWDEMRTDVLGLSHIQFRYQCQYNSEPSDPGCMVYTSAGKVSLHCKTSLVVWVAGV
ncbi:hypothetical protein MVEN_01465400 [Mycena venus]|uniref:Uncharacterized protein n=1 Tax=Mycena venus TaxID=2733690 RepID=A0A8H7CTR0_9AGAR|nr:hypothetical protein MVEN_01465400 [Mycena venus]